MRDKRELQLGAFPFLAASLSSPACPNKSVAARWQVAEAI